MKNNLQIIINSDDFGISNSVNKAIVNSFESGLISSTTLMANMPGFEDAVNFFHSNPILQNKVGLHLNLTAAQPLTDLIKKCDRFCDDAGYFIYNRRKPMFFLNGHEKLAVYTEIKAQISRLLKYNIIPTHLDSHHHVHTELGIARIYMEVAKEFNVKKMRLTKNIGDINFAKRATKKIFNFYLQKIKKIQTTDFFCNANEFMLLMDHNLVKANSSYEIMVHAKLDLDGEIVDICQNNLKNKIEPILSKYELTNYYIL